MTALSQEVASTLKKSGILGFFSGNRHLGDALLIAMNGFNSMLLP